MLNDFVVSDTNVFIDLIEVGLLEEFIRLPWKIYTTDFVLDELKDPHQKKVIGGLSDGGFLTVKRYTANEMTRLLEFRRTLRNKSNLSIQDCSVWQLAEDMSCPLLTGDNKLRSIARRHNIEVHGVLYIIDQIVEYGLLDAEVAIMRLRLLVEINQRLPMDKVGELIRKLSERIAHSTEKTS